MNVITGKTATLSKVVLSEMARFRHQVFIKTLGWRSGARNGEEYDQFDHDDTVYVVAQDAQDTVNGCARLLPTSSPYLLREIFPQLLNGLPMPHDDDIWELSRFAAVDFNNETMSALNQFSSPLAVQLLRDSIACAKAYGAKRLITVAPIGLERLVRRAGFHAHRAGPPTIVDGHPLFACWIDVERGA